jgi:predicted ATP-grasp superfamily ATP-dependent carboligase
MAAGVDFSYLQFADQISETVTACRGTAGIGWLRLLTDVPTAASDILGGHLKFREYLASLRKTQVESVFCRRDPLPSLAEIALLPYLVFKKF